MINRVASYQSSSLLLNFCKIFVKLLPPYDDGIERNVLGTHFKTLKREKAFRCQIFVEWGEERITQRERVWYSIHWNIIVYVVVKSSQSDETRSDQMYSKFQLNLCLPLLIVIELRWIKSSCLIRSNKRSFADVTFANKSQL